MLYFRDGSEQKANDRVGAAHQPSGCAGGDTQYQVHLLWQVSASYSLKVGHSMAGQCILQFKCGSFHGRSVHLTV